MIKILIGVVGLVLAACSHTEYIKNIEAGNEYVKKGMYNQAYTHYKVAIQKEKNAYVAKVNAGIVLAKMGDCNNAIYYLKSANAQNPKALEPNYYLANCLSQKGQLADALNYATKAVQIDVKSKRAVNLQAWIYINMHQPKAALQTLNKIPEAAQQNVATQILRAKIFILMKKMNDASHALAKAQLIKSSAADKSYVFSALGDYYQAVGKNDKAMSNYRKSLNLQPFGYDALVGLSSVLIGRGDLVESVKYLKQATSINEEKPEAYFYLAKAHEKQDREKAVFYHRKFLAYATNYPILSDKIAMSKQVMKQLSSSDTKSKM